VNQITHLPPLDDLCVISKGVLWFAAILYVTAKTYICCNALSAGKGRQLNAYEIEQLEQQVKAELRLPLGYEAWADIEREARQQRARGVAQAFAGFFAAVATNVTGFVRQIRSTAAQCTGARLRHDH
jgi:hypothetical protein